MSKPSGEIARPKKILLVEDDPIGRGAIKDFLTARGYWVSIASTGTEALKKFQEDTPDLLLVDVLLPQRSGFEVCFEVKRVDPSKPVVLMSAVCKDQHSTQYASESLQAQGYLVKPFKMGALLGQIEKLLA